MHHRHRKNWQNHNWEKGDIPEQWKRNPAGLFIWFMFMFGVMITLLLGGVGLIIYTGARAIEETAVPPILIFSTCSLIFFIPMLIFAVGRRTFSGVATVAEVMKAADQVADGDLTARVSETRRRNRFARLAKSFNNMANELEKEDERRRNLTADIAHELRTPLHIIQGNLEGILDGVYEPTLEHILATIEETHTLARLVDDLHTIAQAEAGQLSLHLSQVEVPELFADIETSFSGQTEEKEIQLVSTAAGNLDDLTIEADAGRLDQVLSNLVVNAIRHTPRGGIISLKAYPNDEAVCIEVSDTGEGIPADDLPFIFDRFWRGDRARSHLAGEGGGLGLAIAKQLVQAHNGRISVSSQLGQGTTFTIQLPKPQPENST